MTKEIDCSYTDEITCPYCGYQHDYSCEISEDKNDGIYQCEDCEKSFRFEVEHSVTYTTEKAPCLNKEGDHKWNRGYSIGGWTRSCRFCDKEEPLPEEPK